MTPNAHAIVFAKVVKYKVPVKNKQNHKMIATFTGLGSIPKLISGPQLKKPPTKNHKGKYIIKFTGSLKNNFGYKTYFITKENFMPLINLIVEWQRSEK